MVAVMVVTAMMLGVVVDASAGHQRIVGRCDV
jgi:hypothetical protein